MSKNKHVHQAAEQKRPATQQDKQERKARIQSDGRSSTTRSIANAVVVKHGDMFFLCEPDGDVPLGGEHGLGLYYHDCRFLNGYEMKLADAKPEVLVATATRGFMAIFELTNPDIKMPGGTLIKKQELGIEWKRVIDGSKLTLCDVFTFRNYALQQVTIPFTLTFQSEFEPLFTVRGMVRDKLGTLHPPCWKENALSLRYDGIDDIYRSLSVHFSPAPQSTKDMTAHFTLALAPEESKEIVISLCIAESKEWSEVEAKAQQQLDTKNIERALQDSSDQCLADETEIRSDSLLLNSLMDRSLRDLHLLKTNIGGQEFSPPACPGMSRYLDAIVSSPLSRPSPVMPAWPSRHSGCWRSIRGARSRNGAMSSRARSCMSSG